ncbi:CPBP family intramembrane glutamic endopeptidase [Leptolyngbya iicbica]|uniref:CPBP family intramembrane metalloprotease n=2 Tax=Cyanophyceae TaxID=3028117 RepID=A0A4Q7ELA3_9CYAN|nr:type II CAAX endopeptidase family protein [Leptolyngbya sp. LK]RZM82589.1 CPBP family intramembrane metalloprotease [Leptolyngbya sp. LK]
MDSELAPQFPSTLRRIVLVVITLLVSLIMGSALIASWKEPQVASRLELYQTDLLLQATAWEGDGLPAEQVATLRRNLLGADPIADAQKNYASVRATAVNTLDENAALAGDAASVSPRLQNAIAGQSELLDLLDLRLGILEAEQQAFEAAQANWEGVKSRHATGDRLWRTADTLDALWHDRSLPDDSEALISTTLQGWFQNRALAQYYRRTQDSAALAALEQAEADQAQGLILTLAAVGVFPAVGALTGILLLIGLGIQRLVKGADALLAQNRDRGWEVPWSAETIWIVVVGGFLFMGQLVVPVVISPLRGVLAGAGTRGQALFALTYYLMMSVGAIAVLWFAIRSYRPLPPDWFKFKLRSNWWLWGLGGYFAALPLMLTVSVLNQQIWQGQGGSNPLLQTVLEAQDPFALAIFFTTASVAAPLFEEFLFRGFLLPSLTRYMPVGGAIAVSSLVFAIAHLSLSEVLPLAVLGGVLGIVYTRSRNLLAPMLLHSAWNSVTMLGLFLLGSSAN